MADFTGIDLFGEIYDADDANAVQQSQVVPTVDSDSDDDHVPTAKAVYDAITAAPSDFYDNKVVAFPENTTAITITPDSIELTADDSVTIVPDKPYTRVTFTDWGNLSGADITNFTYIGQPADFSSIADMVIEFLPDKTILGLKCLIQTGGGDDHYAYYFYRVLEHETAEAYAGMDNLLFAPEWDMLSLYPTINASNELEGLVINGAAYPVKDPNAADQTLSNLTDASDARDNLGLGAAATKDVSLGYAAASAANDLIDITVLRHANAVSNNETFVTNAANSVRSKNIFTKTLYMTGLNIMPNATADTGQDFTGFDEIIDLRCTAFEGNDDHWFTALADIDYDGNISINNNRSFGPIMKAFVTITYTKN